jgi:hypothetical protein
MALRKRSLEAPTRRSLEGVKRCVNQPQSEGDKRSDLLATAVRKGCKQSDLFNYRSQEGLQAKRAERALRAPAKSGAAAMLRALEISEGREERGRAKLAPLASLDPNCSNPWPSTSTSVRIRRLPNCGS